MGAFFVGLNREDSKPRPVREWANEGSVSPVGCSPQGESDLSLLARNERRRRSKASVRRLSERMNPAGLTNGKAPLAGAFFVGLSREDPTTAGGFVTPGKPSGGRFSVKNGWQPRGIFISDADQSVNVCLEYDVDFDYFLHYNPIANVETLH